MTISEIKARRTYYDTISGEPVYVTGYRDVPLYKQDRTERWCRTRSRDGGAGCLVHPSRLTDVRPTHKWDGSPVEPIQTEG